LAADYAAKFLVDLNHEFDDWNTAAKTYHSRRRAQRERYGRKLAAAQKSLNQQQGETKKQLLPALRDVDFNVSAASGAGSVGLAAFADRAPLFEQRQFQRLIEGGDNSDL
jgi:hypothetical protein